MQHLDEGTIHTWLDGALAPEEAARAEQHVADCAECAGAVAEARGFIAASSRILTKLDDVPRGVLPAARPIRRRNVAAWRAAAAVLVVAVGSFVVLRNQRGERKNATESTAVTNARVLSAPAPDVGLADSARTEAPAASGKVSNPPAVAAAPLAAPSVPIRAEQRQARDQATEPAYAGRAAQSNLAVAPASAEAVTEAPLQLVREETVPGGRRSVYTVASSDTVTLFEPLPADLQSAATAMSAPSAARRATSAPAVNELSAKVPAIVVDTGVIAATMGSATAQSARMRAASPATPPSTGAAQMVRPIRTIRWTDSTSGRMLTLSGPLPVERLEEIKKRIERERAMAKKPAR